MIKTQKAYSSVLEHSTVDREVPRLNPGVIYSICLAFWVILYSIDNVKLIHYKKQHLHHLKLSRNVEQTYSDIFYLDR